MSNDLSYVASCDTLKKINVVNWPNVFNLQSVLLEHTLAIQHMCLVGNAAVASISEPNETTKEQDFILSKTVDGEVIN